MEPRKYIKKYNFDGFDYEAELYKHLANITRRIQINKRNRYNRTWVVVSPRVVEVLNDLENENRG